ncbi:hypothetical protein NSP05_24330, partial [Salmonella enterica]|nr:hypothetical protein [Salmonella enterica]
MHPRNGWQGSWRRHSQALPQHRRALVQHFLAGRVHRNLDGQRAGQHLAALRVDYFLLDLQPFLPYHDARDHAQRLVEQQRA